MLTGSRRQGGRVWPFAVVLWFFGSFFLLGDLGKWMDDWMFHARDPVTDTIVWERLWAADPLNTGFWRPLHIHAAMFVQSVFWHQDWLIHLLLAAVHGANAWLVGRLVRGFGLGWRSAAAASVIFLTYPCTYEAVFWLSTVGTVVGMWWFLVCARAVQRFARGEASVWGLVAAAPLLLLLGWWYEQSAACGPALGMIYLASRRREPGRREFAWPRREWLLAGGIVAVAVVAGVAQVGLLFSSMAPEARGGSGSVVKAGEMRDHVAIIAQQAWDSLTLAGFASGALNLGWRALQEHPARAIAAGCVALVALAGFVRAWVTVRRRDIAPDTQAAAAARPLVVATIGMAIIAASFVPILAIRDQWFAPRLAYHPLLGVVLLLACGVDAACRRPAFRARATVGGAIRWASAAALLAVGALGAVMLIGVQQVWSTRVRVDARVRTAMLEQVPDPPKDAVFVPVRIRGWPTHTGSLAVDSMGNSPFEYHWTASLLLRGYYQRIDVNGLAINRWLPQGACVAGCEGGTETHLVLAGAVMPNVQTVMDAAGHRLIPWDAVVAYELTGGGRVRIADAVRIVDVGNPANDRLLPLRTGVAARARSGDDLSVIRPLVVRRFGQSGAAETVLWRLCGPDASGPERAPRDRIAMENATAIGESYAAFPMHPPVGPISDRCELRGEIPPAAGTRTVALRVAMPDYVLGSTDGVLVTVYAASGSGEERALAREEITPRRFREDGRWIVLRGDLPPSNAPTRIRIAIGPGAAGNPNSDWCWVTPPVVALPPAR